ncbi:hypothetical protein BDU57DRAFT_568919 [Ampelomyces quisqualis]|uniref:Uncharacterized protein n=1 Tax=Ampelomyces quisqualis TaxID=50730 RepID=A0A6A5QV69_AMPQU|nr:hypothetical protein BDU57DRAFT_568919 [Ampelomyces quisqualis]
MCLMRSPTRLRIKHLPQNPCLEFWPRRTRPLRIDCLVNDVRFHIIVDPKDLQMSRENPFYYEYLEKICSPRDAEQREEEATEGQKLVGKEEKKKQSQDKDSAVDMSADEDSNQDQDSGSAAVELRNWILSAFGNVTAEWAPADREPVESTLYEWYHGPTYFYSLQIKNKLEACIEKLVPRLKMPKYVQSIDVPWINANDLIVQYENIYFFKPAVPDEPGPVKREISILPKLAELDLDIKVPQLLCFVSVHNSKTETIGFLLLNIDSPEPLTKLLKSNNFMVDANDALWIIDFGGSYTNGWVDPGLSETREGDYMGLGKVVQALEDPDGETFGPEETAREVFVTEMPRKSGEKRERGEEGETKQIGGKMLKEDEGEK